MYGHFLATQQDLNTALLKHLAAYELTNDPNYKADALYTKAGTFIQTKKYAYAIFALAAAYDECKTDYCLRPMFHQMITRSRMIQLHEEGHTIDLETIQQKAQEIFKAPKKAFLKFLDISLKSVRDELKKFEVQGSLIIPEPIDISKLKAAVEVTNTESEDDILDNVLDEIFSDLSLNGSDALEESN